MITRITRIVFICLALIALLAASVLAAAPEKRAGQDLSPSVQGGAPAAGGSGAGGGQSGDIMGGSTMGGGMMGGGMMGNMPAEKQAAVKKIKDDYRDKLFAIHQDIHAKYAELNAIMLQAQPDVNKAKAVSKDLAALKGQMLDQEIEMHARIAKETGVRLPIMPGGMGMMGGGMMGGGGCGMMGGGGGMMGGGGAGAGGGAHAGHGAGGGQ